MPVPEFVLELRRHMGHAPLWLPGVTGVVIRDEQVLLVKRADNGAWTAVTGIVDPGENPADSAIREVWEEAGVRALPTRLVWVHVSRPMVHVNGDHAQYLDHVFRMDWLSGSPYPADGENVAAQWFDIAAMPDMAEDMRRRIELAADTDSVATVFDIAGPQD
ncbi:ADP-ribose pyrophosphatase [Mycobacteroides franklinii]|uniref:ADP-ribose pyrophosphatase n=1 Tax=Mycobacteroides franklinii TaxID=948102 RepID=A0A1S1L9D5_9MYCO|nr:NUDIX domain-containing protein [Mycobacteroides franklinii]OHU30649.1 ADP-ribose pyrophosphatase [Mycobacteroides franklinii]